MIYMLIKLFRKIFNHNHWFKLMFERNLNIWLWFPDGALLTILTFLVLSQNINFVLWLFSSKKRDFSILLLQIEKPQKFIFYPIQITIIFQVTFKLIHSSLQSFIKMMEKRFWEILAFCFHIYQCFYERFSFFNDSSGRFRICMIPNCSFFRYSSFE